MCVCHPIPPPSPPELKDPKPTLNKKGLERRSFSGITCTNGERSCDYLPGSWQTLRKLASDNKKDIHTKLMNAVQMKVLFRDLIFNRCKIWSFLFQDVL